LFNNLHLVGNVSLSFTRSSELYPQVFILVLVFYPSNVILCVINSSSEILPDNHNGRFIFIQLHLVISAPFFDF